MGNRQRFLRGRSPCRAVQQDLPQNIEQHHNANNRPKRGSGGIGERAAKKHRSDLFKHLKRNCGDQSGMESGTPGHLGSWKIRNQPETKHKVSDHAQQDRNDL